MATCAIYYPVEFPYSFLFHVSNWSGDLIYSLDMTCNLVLSYEFVITVVWYEWLAVSYNDV